MHRARIALVALTFASAFLAATASAQNDHFKCYKIKDVAQFKAATADLIASQTQFPGENCSFKGKGAQLCVPVDKDNVVVTDGTDQDFATQDLTNAQLCYKLKCPSTTSENLQISDQFGTRTLTKGKASKVCGPVLEQP
jgi:hypothetical protein